MPSDLLPGVYTEEGMRILNIYNEIYRFLLNIYTNLIPRTLSL